jgi:hypothetical protein
MTSVENTHFAYVLIHLFGSKYFLLIDHVRYPDQRLLVGMLLHVAIKHIVCNVDLSVSVPASELGSGIVQNLSWEFEPTDFLCVLCPVGFPLGLRIGPLAANLIRVGLHFEGFYFKGLM